MIPELIITIPIWIKDNRRTLDMTLECVKRIKSNTVNNIRVYVVSNRLHLISPEDLQIELTRECPSEIILLHEDGISRSVAGAWNEGTIRGLSDKSDLFMLMANDCYLEPTTIDKLVEYRPKAKLDAVAIWSGLDVRGRLVVDDLAVTDGSDFTCLMYTRDTIYKHGYFDAEFKPAYFEDNDYYARVVLGGEHCRVVHSAHFFHYGSATTALEPDCAAHARHWFPINKGRFKSKWGIEVPAVDESGVLQSYNRRPWQDVNRPLSSW